MEEIIRVEGLSFTYEGQPRPAIENIDLAVRKGEFLVVLGHNGSGKSTLAKCFNAILLPSSGRVLVGGMDTADESRLFDIRQRVGMVFQNPDNQIVSSIVEEDVAFAPENLGVPRGEMLERIDYALRAVGMQDYRSHSTSQLSGGQKQRIAIAGVIAMRPKVLILDEPTAGLDPGGCEGILKNITDYREQTGSTVLLVTHSMDDAARIADRLVVFHQGEIAMDGTPDEVFSRPKELTAMGLDVPQPAAIAQALRERGAALPPSIYTLDQLRAALVPLRKGAAD